MSTKRVAVALSILAIALLVWFARNSRSSTTAAQPRTRSFEDSTSQVMSALDSPEESPRPTTTTSPEPSTVEGRRALDQPLASSISVFGFVWPPDDKAALQEKPYVRIVDSHAEQVSTEGGDDGAYSLTVLRPGKY